jgi:hypothetical protein
MVVIIGLIVLWQVCAIGFFRSYQGTLASDFDAIVREYRSTSTEFET